MPSITTHHIFAEDLYEQFDEDTKKSIKDSIKIYHAFAQSHDYLFYYTFDLNIKNVFKYRKLGSYAHKHKTQNYLINLANNIKEMNLENNSEALAYLYGSITHYVLDSTCHPFIFYKTGACNSDDRSTFKYRGEHTRIEKDLDAIYYKKKYKKEYNKCNITKDIIGKFKFSNELNKLIDKTYEQTYKEKNISKYYFKSIKHAKLINFIIVNDYFGIKRGLYFILEKLFNKRLGCNTAYSTHILKPNLSYLNLEHKEWNHPCNKEIKYTSSFEDLYQESLDKALKIIKALNKYLYENKDEEYLKKYIPDVSYSNGLLIKDYVPMKYFEY